MLYINMKYVLRSLTTYLELYNFKKIFIHKAVLFELIMSEKKRVEGVLKCTKSSFREYELMV